MRSSIPPQLLQALISAAVPAVVFVPNRIALVIILVVTFRWIEFSRWQ